MTPRSASAAALAALLALPQNALADPVSVDKALVDRFGPDKRQQFAEWTILKEVPKIGTPVLPGALEPLQIYYGVLKNPPSDKAKWAVSFQTSEASPLSRDAVPLFSDVGGSRQTIILDNTFPTIANGNGFVTMPRGAISLRGGNQPMILNVPDGETIDWNALRRRPTGSDNGRVVLLDPQGTRKDALPTLTWNGTRFVAAGSEEPVWRPGTPLRAGTGGAGSNLRQLVVLPGNGEEDLVIVDPRTPTGGLLTQNFTLQRPDNARLLMAGLALDPPAGNGRIFLSNDDRWRPDFFRDPMSFFNVGGGRTRDPLSFLNAPLTLPQNNEPVYRATLTDYVYDAKAKALVSTTGQRISVEELPGSTGSFLTTPLVVAPGKFKLEDKTLRTTNNATVRVEDQGVKKHADLAPTLAAYGGWKGVPTDLAKWRQADTPVIVVAKMTVFCYHPKIRPDQSLVDALNANRADNKSAPCVAWEKVPPDNTQTAGGKKYRVREYAKSLWGSAGIKDGKLVLRLGESAVVDLTEGTLDKAAFGDATHVQVQEKGATPPAPPVVKLSEETGELRWLTRAERDAYKAGETAAEAAAREKGEDLNAALKRVVDEFRAKVAANVRPEAKSAYERSYTVSGDAVPKAADILAALKDVKMWGHMDGADAKAPMEPHGPNAELQLSKAQYDEIAKTDKLTDYLAARVGISGAPPGKPEEFDPVALRKTLVEFKKAAGIAETPAGTPAGEQPKPEVSKAPLTPEEVALLTPNEAKQYKAAVDAATINGKLNPEDPNLQRYAQALRKRIQDDKRTAPYDPAKAPTTQAEFDAMPDHAKRQFCEPILNAPATAGAPKLEGGALQQARTCSDAGGLCGDAQDGRTGVTVHQHGPAPQTAGAWDAKKACQGLPQEPNLDVGGSAPGNPGTGDNGVAANLTSGEDKEKGKAEQNPLTKPSHIYNGAKGALLGFLIGSFLGPVGMIAGALIGAAVFYGISLGADKLDGKK